ncbi:MAG TPA: ABC transporter permease [Nitrospiraceae bacterium]|nr:ABC transporter permease [Nitrospiraceae bacterium]
MNKIAIGGTEPVQSASPRAAQAVYLRDLLRELVGRDMKLRYKRSVLGIVWSLLNPLAQFSVLYFVFHVLLPLNIPHYASFLFTGMLTWNWFQSSLLFATGAIVENRELVKRPGFPAAILPTVTVTSHLVHFLLAIPILLLCVVLDVGRPTPAIAALPLVIAIQFTLILGLAYVVAALYVTFRDTQYLLGVLLQLLFFLTPVFYDLATVPERYRGLLTLNPMVHLIEAYRAILIHGTWPDRGALMILIGGTGLLLAAGYLIFERASSRFVEEL